MAADTRSRIVTATNELFRLKGYTATTLAEISAAAEAPVGSIYHFFPGGKVELTEAVVVETGEVYRELLALFLAEASSPGEAVEAFFVAAAETLETSGFLDPCPIGGVGREVASVDDRLRGAVGRVFDSWVRTLGAELAAIGITPDRGEAVARSVIALLEGGFVFARVERDADMLRDGGVEARAMIERTAAAAAVPGSR
jgi:AcrR family transcriptional regulator